MRFQGEDAATAPASEAQGAAPAQVEPSEFGRRIDELFGKVEFLRDHPSLQAILILVAAFLVARILAWLVTRVLRNLTARTRIKFDDRIVAWIPAPLVRSTVVIGIAAAAHVLPLSETWDARTHHMLMTVAALCWAPFLFRTTSLLLKSASTQEQRFQAPTAWTSTGLPET